ncbi:MAG: hypothetical protein AB7V45_11435 [Candidatus Krumholzibacteriia bacterium]
MIELNTVYNTGRVADEPASLHFDSLRFSFPDVHPDARFELGFQRTLRIPDDDSIHYLPPGLGNFPLRHVDDFAERLPARWREHGGVMMPMYQAEAMWIDFTSRSEYPFLVKIAAGKINAVTGEAWRDSPNRDPQDYVVLPRQPWLDGFCVKKGEIRQFVAAPLGSGYSVEEQVTGEAEHGGLQIIAYPMKAEEWEKILEERRRERERIGIRYRKAKSLMPMMECLAAPDMGLAEGGRMKQTIEADPYDFSVWDLRHSSRCFVHITNSVAWRAITGEAPPTLPPTAAQYTAAGLPWFDYYSEAPAVEGSGILDRVKSVAELDKEKAATGSGGMLPENEPTGEVRIVKLGTPPGGPRKVREF